MDAADSNSEYEAEPGWITPAGRHKVACEDCGIAQAMPSYWARVSQLRVLERKIIANPLTEAFAEA